MLVDFVTTPSGIKKHQKKKNANTFKPQIALVYLVLFEGS